MRATPVRPPVAPAVNGRTVFPRPASRAAGSAPSRRRKATPTEKTSGTICVVAGVNCVIEVITANPMKRPTRMLSAEKTIKSASGLGEPRGCGRCTNSRERLSGVSGQGCRCSWAERVGLDKALGKRSGSRIIPSIIAEGLVPAAMRARGTVTPTTRAPPPSHRVLESRRADGAGSQRDHDGERGGGNVECEKATQASPIFELISSSGSATTPTSTTGRSQRRWARAG